MKKSVISGISKFAFLVIGLCIVMLPKNTFSYFEDRYYCNIKDTSIIVSLREDPGFQKCVTLSRGLDEKIYQLDDNIAKADKFIKKKEDVEYRTNLKITLIKQKQSLEYVYEQLNQNIDKFESDVFLRVQKILSYYLTKERNLVSVRIDKTKENITNARRNGNLQNFSDNIKILDTLTFQRNILDAILDSQKFDEMIPFLRYYLKTYGNKS